MSTGRGFGTNNPKNQKPKKNTPNKKSGETLVYTTKQKSLFFRLHAIKNGHNPKLKLSNKKYFAKDFLRDKKLIKAIDSCLNPNCHQYLEFKRSMDLLNLNEEEYKQELKDFKKEIIIIVQEQVLSHGYIQQIFRNFDFK